MDTAARDELDLLRARAYGPAADIDQDPAALQRLRELEGLTPDSPTDAGGTASENDVSSAPQSVTAQSVAPQASAGSVHQPDPPADPGDSNPGEAPGALPAAGSPVTGPITIAEHTRLSTRVRLVWVAGVVAAAAAASGLTLSLASFTPVPVSSGATQIATLSPSPTATIPAGFFGVGPSSKVFEFYGLTLFESSNMFTGATSDGCFAVVPTEELPDEESVTNGYSISGNVYSDCRVGVFPATVEVPLGINAPEELRSRYPEGSALQFVLRDELIGVYLASG